MFVATKHVFCSHKSMLKGFVATNIFSSQQNVCHDKHNFVAISLLLSPQTRVCRDKTGLLSRPNFCRNTHVFVATNIFDNKGFVATNIIL